MKDQLKELVEYLYISPKRIQQNIDYGLVIEGKRGFIRADEGHWTIVVRDMSRRYCSSVKRKLSFMTIGPIVEVIHNGKAIRSLQCTLSRMPTETEADMIRKVLQISRRRKLNQDQRIALAERLSKARLLRGGTISEDLLKEDKLVA